MVIYKYSLGVGGDRTLIKNVHKFLKVDNQPGSGPQVWAVVDEEKIFGSDYEIECYGTGWPIKDYNGYIGTLIDDYGYVWHYFARRKDKNTLDMYAESTIYNTMDNLATLSRFDGQPWTYTISGDTITITELKE